MAEFRLGRIKFVWQGEWTPSTSYVVDDVISNAGKTWICVVNHTSSSLFVTDGDFIPPKWHLVSDGLSWRGDWETSTYYNVGDQVKYGGNVYVANEAHTSAATTTLGLEADQDLPTQTNSKWDLIASSFYWTGSWTTTTRYRVNDFVVYGGITYFCNTAHTSAATSLLGLEDDQNYWTNFNNGIVYLGEWTDSVRYKENDIVKYGSGSWICTTNHTSDTTFDDTKWSVFVEGLEFEDSWNSLTVYQIGDVVTYGGYSYIAKTNNSNSNPSTGATATIDWQLYTTGFNFVGDWNNSTTYKVGDVVRLGGYTYLSITDNLNQTPPNTSYWHQLNSGFKWINSPVTYTDISGITLTGIGSGATFDITRNGTSYSVDYSSTGTNYEVGDTILISGSDLGGLSPINDAIITVESLVGGYIATLSATGYAVTWTNGDSYIKGDIVFFGANSYVAIIAHIATSTNRPDQDTTAEFWNLLAAGSESAVLTTEGDTYYFGNNGPTRLPIGTDGQLLRVNNGYPSWEYYGIINNVVYVAPTGVDDRDPGRGLTIDKPWRTVRYACTQIERGYRNTNAIELLRMNKQFIMKEVSNWVTSTYSVSISASVASTGEFTANDTSNLVANMPIEFNGTLGGVTANTKYFVKTVIDSTHFTISTTQGGLIFGLSDDSGSMIGSLSYDYNFCQRDVGILLDAVIYDLGHGGNEYVTNAAKAYYTTSGSSYINSNFGQQITQTVAAYNYMKNLVANVINNCPPIINYQELNGLTSGIASQVIETSYVAEESSSDTAIALLTIITDGILAGDTSAIAPASYGNTTISVKTGTFVEVLPIIIPNHVAVVGDELRSTNISPNSAITNLVNDKPKTISALNRIKALVPNLVSNNIVEASIGNSAEQQYVFNNYESIASESVRANVITAQDILEDGSTTVPVTIVDPIGYDDGYYNARRLIVANKEFLKAEAIAYVNYNFVNYNSNYDSATCSRDVGLIIDAVCYDLVTGSNFASSVAGEAYYRIQSDPVTSNQLFQTLDVINFVKTAASDYVHSSLLLQAEQAFDNVYNILENGLTAVPVYVWPDNGTSDATSVADALALQTNRATLISGVTTYLSSTSPYDAVWAGLSTEQQAKCARDTGYIIDAITYDVQYGGNYQSIVAGLAYYSFGVLEIASGEKAATIAAYNQLGGLMKTYTSGTADTSIDALVTIITGIINTGSAPAITYPSASAESIAVQSTLSSLQSAKSSIQASTISYITATYNGLSYDTVACARDVGYIVDALEYDLTYGGNLATQIAARAYYSKGDFVEPLTEKKAALATQLRLRNIISDIAQGVLITKTSGNALSQDDSGTAGSSGAGTFAQSRIIDMYNTIKTGNNPIPVLPNTTNVLSNKVTALTSILARKSQIQTIGINWVTTNYPLLQFDQTLCSRDIGYIVEALAYDMVFDSNFLTQWSALSYYRGLTSTGVVISDQKEETIGLMFAIGLAVLDASGGTDSITTSLNAMTSIIANGLTAVPTFNLPVPTGGTGNAFTAGYYDAARLVLLNKAFLKAEITAWINVQIAGPIAPFSGFVYDQATCERDVGYIVDALHYDLTYGGNLATQIAARSYYSNGVLVETGEEAQALAVWAYVKTIIDDIVKGLSITKSSGNLETQITAGSAGSAGAATFAQNRIQELYDTIDTGIEPTTVSPDITWVHAAFSNANTAIQAEKTLIKTTVTNWINSTYPELIYNEITCQRDIGFIVDAVCYDMMFGSNFLSCWNAMSYHRALTSTGVVLAQQLQPTLGTIGVVGSFVKELAYETSGYVGNIVNADWVEVSTNTIYDIINNGLNSTPNEIITDPADLDVNYENARTQLANNYAFIKADVSKYIENNYSSVWTALGATGQASCQRDVGYILDAIRYDLTYGGNTQSLIAGSAYWSGIVRTINSTELTATLAAYTHLKSIIDDIAKKLAVTPQAGNSTLQVLSGTGGNAGSATFAQDRVQDVIDWITNGTSPSTISPTLPTDNASTLAYELMQARKTEVQNDALGYVQKFFQSMSYDEDVCYRDVGYMVDAIMYDMLFKSNVAAITVGRSYYRAIDSAEIVISNQKHASLGLVKFLKYKLKGYAVGGAISKASTVIDDIIGTIDGGAVPRFLWPDFTGIDAENFAAAKLIFENKKFIQAETLKYINDNYPAVVYDHLTCARDVGYIVDSIRYDMTYGGNFATRQAGISYYSKLTDALQIDTNDKTATLAAYGNLKTIVQDIANGGLSSYTPLQTNTSYIIGTSGDATSATVVGSLIDGITTTINSGIASAPAETLPSTSWVATNLVTQATALISAKSTVQTAVTSYIEINYPNLNYDSTTCERDVGYIIDAVAYDMMLGSNFRSIKSGMAYYQAQASKVLDDQKRATLNAFRFLKDELKDIVVSDSDALASVNENMTIVLNILDKGVGETPDVNGSVTYLNNLGNTYAVEVLRANKQFLENEATAWIKNTFTGIVISTSSTTSVLTTSSAHNLTVGDPVIFPNNVISTSATSSSSVGNLITLLSTTGIITGSKITFTNGTLGNLVAGTVYYVKTVENTTQITVSASYNGSVFDPGTSTSVVTATIGDILGGLDFGIQYYVKTTPSSTTLTLTDTINGTSTLTVTTDTGAAVIVYSFDEVSCKRDMGEYVLALVDDLQLPGNHKGTHAALLYNNAVSGSEASDMFWVSNASGLRNLTMSGLSGDLTELNDFGTRRPTAGAYVALNPGFGPFDSRVWVTSRSHYSQNCTMFGAGCSGAKIDAALHRYGNKSMVKNDFTTIISDGIGVWCTGEDSLTELVSVFNYYGYSGYLAELGGRIRATNGNSSYGTYGVIAEGVDVHEVPLYATVDNRYNQAQATLVITDGVTEIHRVEFGNAGTTYTNVSYTLSGAGYNAAATGDEFRDGAVFETRIIDLNDDNGVGGTSYATQSNAAQTGDTTSITIAATDTALTNSYNGMRVQLTAGTGAGQYANILTYSGGSKIATVYKDSFTSITVTSTTDTGDYVNVASNATLYVDMPIYFTGTTFGNITANTLYYVKALNGTTQFTISTIAGGTAVNVTTGTGSMTLLAAGWDHVIPGRTIENALDLTTQYIIEPTINYTAPGYRATARTLSSTAAWKDITYGDSKYLAIAGSGQSTTYSTTGTTWATAGSLSASASWTDVVYGGGEGAVATVTIGGLGGQGAVLQAVLGVPNTTGAATDDQVASVTVINGGAGYTTPPVIVFTSVSGGTGAVATCAVLNGEIVSVTVTIPGSGYNAAPTVAAVTDRVTIATSVDWGRNYFSTPSVTVSDPFTGSAWSSGGVVTLNQTIYYVNTGVKHWYTVTTGGTFTTTGPIHTSGSASNGTAVLLYIGTTAILTPTLENAGVKTLTITNSGKGYTTTPTVTILDTGARYVAIATGSSDNCYTTSAGVLAGSAWTAGSALPASDFVSLTYGNGVYVAVGGTNSAASSTNGSTWTGRSIPTLGSGTYSAVVYGNGTFVAISTGNLVTAVSSNGNSWTAGGNLPTSTTWSSIAYGNGRFVAIESGGRNVAISTDKGTSWVAATPGLPSSQTWNKVSYGQGLFLAVSSGGSVAATSPDGINWTVRALSSSSNWISAQFGNTNDTPVWVAISNTSGTVACSIKTGAQALGRVKVSSGVVTEVRMIEPGSGYPTGTVTAATGGATDSITVSDTTNLIDSQPIEFTGCSSAGLVENITYYVIGSTIVTDTSFKVSATAGSSTPVNLTTVTGLSGTYRAGPIFTVTDPNKVKSAAFRVRMGDGALGNPSFSNRGTDMTTATAEPNGDGYADLYQPSSFINVEGLYDIPEAGANVEFDSLPGVYFKLVTITNELGSLGSKTATFQINPALSVLQAPVHGDRVTARIKYSQVRLTGHDFLYIGTGGKERTNYPNVDISTAIQANQTVYSAGGRVFFTSTDQDGNFNVGNLFGVQQATGTATLNASAFNLSGLNSLQLGSVELGVGSAIITQFSTDPFFTADSDSIVPTQRAIKSYITSQIGGGQSSLNVNTLTSGIVYIAGNSISTTTGEAINVTTKMNFTGGIDGSPVALGFFMQR
jgi:hypothetical protein